LSNTYENLKSDKTSSPETEDFDIDADDNVYDVAEFVEGDAADARSRPHQDVPVDAEASPPSQEPEAAPQQSRQQQQPERTFSATDGEAGTCLIENGGEKTIIFTSAAIANASASANASSQNKNNERNVENNGTSNSEPQILISSSSWIDLVPDDA